MDHEIAYQVKFLFGRQQHKKLSSTNVFQKQPKLSSRLVSQAAASAAMEARDRLEDELSDAHQAAEALQQRQDELAAQLQEATQAQAASRPEDAARIAQLSDQVSLLWPFPNLHWMLSCC